MADAVVIVTATDFTTIVLTSTSSLLQAIPASSVVKSANTPTPSSFPSIISIPAHGTKPILLPSGWPQPTSPSESPSQAVEKGIIPQNNTLANIVLVAIVLIVVLYIVLFGLAIITWWKGRCPNCEGIENKLKRMEQRKMVDVTKEDIEEREKIRAHRASALASLESNVRQVDSGSDQDIRQTAWPNWNQFSGMAVPTQTIGINSGTSTPTLPTARCGDERSIYIGMPASPTLAYNPYSRVSRNASVYSHTTQSQRIPYAN